MPKQKPELHLLKGDSAQDLDQLAKFFEKMTGRKPTAKELERARAKVKKGPAGDGRR